MYMFINKLIFMFVPDSFGGDMELIQALHNAEAFLADKS
jgi:hypothetical protein